MTREPWRMPNQSGDELPAVELPDVVYLLQLPGNERTYLDAAMGEQLEALMDQPEVAPAFVTIVDLSGARWRARLAALYLSRTTRASRARDVAICRRWDEEMHVDDDD